MLKKFLLAAAIASVMVAALVFTVIDHLIIGVIAFFAMIAMVAFGPRSAADDGESDMARARRSLQRASREGENGGG